MQLGQWISELNAAVTERDLVAVMRAFFRQVVHTTTLPEHCLPAEPGNAAEIRRAASWLGALQLTDCANNGNGRAFEQLATLFRLAAERVTMLEARGMLIPQRL